VSVDVAAVDVAAVAAVAVAAACGDPTSSTRRHFVRVIWNEEKKSGEKQQPLVCCYIERAKQGDKESKQSETAHNVYLIVRVSCILYLRRIRTPLAKKPRPQDHQTTNGDSGPKKRRCD